MRNLWLAALILSVSPTVRLSAQARPWQSTDYYRLTVVSSPALSPDALTALEPVLYMPDSV